MKRTGLIALAFLIVLGVPAHAEGDAAKGERLFNLQCGTCHAFDPAAKKQGPHLQHLIGRKAGAVEGFKYSKGFEGIDIVWDEETLSTFLKDPKAMIPGTIKVVRVAQDAQRADLVAYLVKAGAPPAPAPAPVQ